jgi:hypothetical protein
MSCECCKIRYLRERLCNALLEYENHQMEMVADYESEKKNTELQEDIEHLKWEIEQHEIHN